MNEKLNKVRRPQPMRLWRVYHLTDVRSEDQQELDHNYELLNVERDAMKAASLYRAPTESSEYKLVAYVEASNPSEVICMTNTVDVPWWENAGVRPVFGSEVCRSSGIGDIVVDDRGVGHFRNRFGWESIGVVAEHRESTRYTLPLEYLQCALRHRLAAIVLRGIPGKADQSIMIEPVPA